MLPAQVSCVIKEMNSPPANPDNVKCLGGAEWGHLVLSMLDLKGSSSLKVGCGSVPDNFTYSVQSAPVLPYEQTDVTAGGVCVSRQSGMTCRQRVGDQIGWGFTISKSGITMIREFEPTPDEWKMP